MDTTSEDGLHSEKFAPVIIPTCNRWQHFKNLVHSLQACPLAEQTHLYIALDAPFSKAVEEENRRILQFAENITGFARVTIWKREWNLGAVGNIAVAVDQVFQNHDRLIFLEDDNVVAKNFLLFMNQAMDAFASDRRCFSVSGYHFMPRQNGSPKADIYRSPFFTAWGAGLFRDRFTHAARLQGPRPTFFFLNPLNLWRAYRLHPRLFSMYMEAWLQGKVYGDIIYRIHSLQNGFYTVFPTATKVINQGFDGSGLHCGVVEKPVHDLFEDEAHLKFDFSTNHEVDSYFQHTNRRWFSGRRKVKLSHTLSLYWRYLTRVCGLRPSRKK
jgi:hypothetical protein